MAFALRCLAVALLGIALGGAEARAEPDVRVLAGVAGLFATSDGATRLGNAELDLTLRADARNLGDRVDLRIDYLGRQGFADLDFWNRPGDKGNGSVHLLRDLSARIRVNRRVRLTLGRFSTPGDFWLVVNGARLELEYTPWLSQSVYGGLRAFTTGFREALIDSHPTVLGLAGTSLDLRTRLVDGQLLFTWAQDRLDFSNQWNGDRLVLEPHVEDDYFLQASLFVHPTPGIDLLGGARLGTRYDMQWNATTPYGPTRIGSANLSSVSAWALAEWAPVRLQRKLRLQYQLNFERIKVFQSQLIGVGPNGLPVSSADGDFQDHALRAVGQLAETMRGDFTYRLRFRQNGNVEHHLVAGLRDSHLAGPLGYLGSVDVTIINPATIFFAPKVQTFVRAVYSIAVTYLDRWFDARFGIHYMDGIGSGLLSAEAPPPSVGNLRTLLFPDVLEANRVVYLSVFYTGNAFYGGFDLEESLVSFQLRAMLQLGLAL
jgi:hypothetical protein